MGLNTTEKLILVTNDDGVSARGIRALVEVAQEFGRVVVVAPNKPQSAMGHAITIYNPIRLHPTDIYPNITEAYACTGTPVDCVKLAVNTVLPRKPDLCLSGINHGSNSAINVIYSGTLSAAMEAAIQGIPSVGFSLLNYNEQADMQPAQKYVRKIIHEMLDKGIGTHHLLNVNIPALPTSEIKGIKICRQSKAKWVEEFAKRQDPFGRPYYWLTGEFVNLEKESTDTDEYALANGYVSVVPVQYDLTAYDDLKLMKTHWNLTNDA